MRIPHSNADRSYLAWLALDRSIACRRKAILTAPSSVQKEWQDEADYAEGLARRLADGEEAIGEATGERPQPVRAVPGSDIIEGAK